VESSTIKKWCIIDIPGLIAYHQLHKNASCRQIPRAGERKRFHISLISF